ncbi:MAG: hypothetical protein ACRDZW_08490, partial [Acidimicrobiales bacterium]
IAAGVELALVVGAVVVANGGGGGEGGGDDVADDVADNVTQLNLPGTAGWTDTGVEVDENQNVQITATGRVSHVEGSFVGPDGEPGSVGHGSNIVAQANHSTLIGRLGEDATPFAVGSSFTATTASGETGTLYLTVNDVGLDNNSGSFDVVIRVREA